jgi:hypothetical protein
MPSLTNSAARRPTSRFASSCVIVQPQPTIRGANLASCEPSFWRSQNLRISLLLVILNAVKNPRISSAAS